MPLEKHSANFEIFRSVRGPLTKNVEDLVYLYRLYMSKDLFELDQRIPRLIFNEKLYRCDIPLRIGVITNIDAIATLSPPMKRAVVIASHALSSQGHDVIPIEIPEIEEQSNMLTDIIMTTMMHSFYNRWSTNADCLNSSIWPMILGHKLPAFVTNGIISLLKQFKQHRKAKMLESLISKNIGDLRTMVSKRMEHLNQVKEIWKYHHLDALIFAHPLPAFQKELAKDVGFIP